MAIAVPNQIRDVRLEGSWPWIALALDIALRVAILVFTLLMPFYCLARRRWPRYVRASAA